MTGKRGTPSERFWRKVDKNGPLPAAWSPARKGGRCWLWTGSMGGPKRDYGYFGARGAHRFAYTDLIGPIPAGLDLDHLCRVRHCVNPAHLEPVTHKENLLRGETIVAEQAKRTECIYGHAFTPGNTYIARDGSRHCKTCAQERERRYRKRDGALSVGDTLGYVCVGCGRSCTWTRRRSGRSPIWCEPACAKRVASKAAYRAMRESQAKAAEA